MRLQTTTVLGPTLLDTVQDETKRPEPTALPQERRPAASLFLGEFASGPTEPMAAEPVRTAYSRDDTEKGEEAPDLSGGSDLVLGVLEPVLAPSLPQNEEGSPAPPSVTSAPGEPRGE